MAIESVGIIPDGTRRWAKREKISLLSGYRHAFANLTAHIEALSTRGVKHVHVYMFSIYNLKRSNDEIKSCLDAECEFLANLIACNKCLYIYGDIVAVSGIHVGISEVINSIISRKPSNDETAIHLYIGYSFMQHIGSILRDEPTVSSAIATLEQLSLDFVVRTGDAITLSDFLPIESRYAQLYFLPTLFNDFTVDDLMDICNKYEATSTTFKYGE